jgi:AmpD protein|tara:strand:- start:20 stop:604 length:585 start_codon:yes stop_codon:yes gene_type:complete
MLLEISDHYFKEALQITSPNWDDRYGQPDGPSGGALAVGLIVIHNISLPAGHFGGRFVEDLFCNTLTADSHPDFSDLMELRVSSHLLIRRAGELVQFVPFHKRAWHAGASTYDGMDNCNDFSIGIELEGTDHCPYNPVQYRLLVDVCMSLIAAYDKLNEDNIVGHSDIAPGRKTDPGVCFDWDLFRHLLRDSQL